MNPPDRADFASIFTQLLHQLDAGTQFAVQMNHALGCVHQATGAAQVFWFNETSGDLAVLPAEAPLSAERCKQFAEKLAARHPDCLSAVVWHAPPNARAEEGPLSAVAVRLRPNQPGWVFAVSLNSTRPLGEAEGRMITLAGTMVINQIKHARVVGQTKGALFDLVCCLGAIIDAKDTCTAGHSERVSQIAVRIGKQMNLPANQIGDLRLAGLLHDIGKVGTRDEVLLKPGKLTVEEMKHIQEHVLVGDEIISTIKLFTRLRPAVRHHHERLDGKGYPDGLAGADIPFSARVMAVADAVDAMMSPRRYRDPIPPPLIDATLLKFSGTQWDPEIVSHFMACSKDIYPPIYRKAIGESAYHAIEGMVEGLTEGSNSYRILDFRSS